MPEPTTDDGAETVAAIPPSHTLAHTATHAPIRPPSPTTTMPVPKLTFTNGLALVLSLQLGSGIFATPSVVYSHTPSALHALLVWLLSGLLIWTGATTFLSLSLALPGTRGIASHLRTIYGDVASRTFCALWLLLAKPAANAMAAFVLAEHLGLAQYRRAVALVAVAGVTGMNCAGVVVGARAANGFLAGKALAVGSIVVLGALWGGSMDAGDGGERDVDYSKALFGALFAFGGWETIGFVAADLYDPPRLLPRITHTSMPLVITAFVGANAALYRVLPAQTLVETRTAAVDFGRALFGPAGATVYAGLVAASCLGALNSSVFGIGRVTAEAAAAGYFPSLLAREDCVYGPLIQFSSQIGSFNGLLSFKGAAEYAVYAATAAGALVLRRRQGRDQRAGVGREAWGEQQQVEVRTVWPVAFVVTATALVMKAVVAEWWIGGALVAAVGVGWGWGWLFGGERRKMLARGAVLG
ncbi:large neutral amino acids transporter small subunit 1 [Geopyxis carbonaria]|nr:large neutral amino acids transporter small subunit 1 [Geopyxis carbonaria]